MHKKHKETLTTPDVTYEELRFYLYDVISLKLQPRSTPEPELKAAQHKIGFPPIAEKKKVWILIPCLVIRIHFMAI